MDPAIRDFEESDPRVLVLTVLAGLWERLPANGSGPLDLDDHPVAHPGPAVMNPRHLAMRPVHPLGLANPCVLAARVDAAVYVDLFEVLGEQRHEPLYVHRGVGLLELG